MTARILAAGALGWLCFVAPAAAQSLADVARKEQVRRDNVQAPGKAYTNADLTEDPRLPAEVAPTVDPPMADPGAPAAAADAVGGKATAPAVTAADSAAVEAPVAGGQDEAYWRKQMAGRRARVDEARRRLANVSGPSEGNQRQQAKMAELKASAEAVLARAEASVAALEREARTVGVPAEWIR